MEGFRLTSRVIVRKGTYRDSITLMKISNDLLKLRGVSQAAVLMGTQLNKRFLADVGFSGDEVAGAETDDMIIAVEAREQVSLAAAIERSEALLSSPPEETEKPAASVGSIEDALRVMPDANLALISVPGQFAKREALRAVMRGLNVFLFSSNVSRRDERELKEAARARNLLMMGPDCGTSIINHKVLGFGNAVRAGHVGLVSAAGTGLQEVSTLVHKGGLGISQAIGTGGGDLSDDVGGITMMKGIDILEGDGETHRLILISKPPGPRTLEKVLERVNRCKKPVIVNFLGSETRNWLDGRHCSATTLEGAAMKACEASGVASPSLSLSEEMLGKAAKESGRMAGSQKYVRGLFAGGTLCYESQIVLSPILKEVHSNSPLRQDRMVDGDAPSEGNVCVDMGAEEFVAGRPHPMIDFTLRNKRILREARDSSTAVILLDVELGYGSNPDPAGQLVPVIRQAKSAARGEGRFLSVIASIVGTDLDYQGLPEQQRRLEEVGVSVAPSNASASRLAALVVSGDSAKKRLFGEG